MTEAAKPLDAPTRKLSDKFDDFMFAASKGHHICLCVDCKPMVMELFGQALAAHAEAAPCKICELRNRQDEALRKWNEGNQQKAEGK